LATKALKRTLPKAHPIMVTIKKALSAQPRPKMQSSLQLLVTGVNGFRAEVLWQNLASLMPVTLPGGELPAASRLQAPFIQKEQAGSVGEVNSSYASQFESAVHAAEHWVSV